MEKKTETETECKSITLAIFRMSETNIQFITSKIFSEYLKQIYSLYLFRKTKLLSEYLKQYNNRFNFIFKLSEIYKNLYEYVCGMKSTKPNIFFLKPVN